jgi:hypothetical protein
MTQDELGITFQALVQDSSTSNVNFDVQNSFDTDFSIFHLLIKSFLLLFAHEHPSGLAHNLII